MATVGRFRSSPTMTAISGSRARNGKYPPVPGRFAFGDIDVAGVVFK